MMRASGRLARIAASVQSMTGWHRGGLAFLLGALTAAAQPPVHFLPVLLVSFPGLVWLLDGARRRRTAFALGWLFGAGYFAAGLYWVSNALLVDAARFAWLIPFTVLGLSFGLSLFIGMATLLARILWAPGLGRILALAGAWTVLEWVRGVVLTGFPWNPIGNVWVIWEPLLQAAAWGGVYGLSAITVFVAASFAMLSVDGRRSLSVPVSGLAILAVLSGAGFLRLSDTPGGTVPGVMLRIVQPNIAQRDKWRPDRRAPNYARHIEMSAIPAVAHAITHVIWPETAAPFSVPTDAVRRRLMRRAIPPGGLLITGTPRFERSGGRVSGAWNSLAVVDERTKVIDVYDKHHLVPLGEYVPFRDILPIEKVTAGSLDFTAGSGLRTLRLPGLPPVSPLICYEAIFPGAVARSDDRPAWLLNVTNDAWFGNSAGPRQHFASARLRAVEEGLPLVRAANSGISGVIDPYGRVLNRLEVGQIGVLDSRLPLPLPFPTLVSRYGNLLPLGCAAILLIGAYFYQLKQRSIKR
ncbi:MAG: apolipoprotein N-acyltransferase [Pseudomonadota bacterium]|jgi:apolipoprotein N-acyltransferase|nr:apolipoprotein N-acyltransferase [Pseudomonadota bacterium]